ncbi:MULTISPECIES: serine/threonine protein kinase [Brevibacillus]|jgi:serine/threonine protein kinase|uniref:Putative serine/threonine-protein kinase YabT n=1 Tax=Brevibacillus parabrevis TaxID=54914 RepID=A0A4Y3PHS1_BREPA|nr:MULTISPECIES: protein kinase [Brevibacillus]TGV17650.1 serine/threonine protein kinase [Mesorhizobium sp. M00.F.Ca.ET.186.01.1.1]MBU8716050.1 protein kinase [Brevibacillus parabrevis]MDH6353021.1 serine/threonine protein kinase [Brevibacillus sp. 1238]MDR5002598.1 protein kinase [Brevibacillus parabrevis]MED1723737.1 protein kinase [Brevibacillus parabrevis]
MSSKAATPDLPKYFQGKWNRKSYHVLRELGRGANGTVYLVSQDGVRRAVKVGVEGMDILMEVNVLKSVQQGRDSKVGPLLCDVDDLVVNGKACTFYAMEYLEGEQLDRYIQQAGTEWVPVLIVQLLARLDVLHKHGYTFGDLKPENIMVSQTDKTVRLIDFGGVTKQGSAVRQFTEEYDRAFWHAGDRKADTGYDLFCAAVIMVRLTVGKELWKSSLSEPRHTGLLCDIIRKSDSLYPYRVPLLKAFHGKFASAGEMRAELLTVLRERTVAQPRKKAPKPGKVGGGISGLFVASLLLLAGTLYYAWFM